VPGAVVQSAMFIACASDGDVSMNNLLFYTLRCLLPTLSACLLVATYATFIIYVGLHAFANTFKAVLKEEL
jgi:hypothetical protein